MTQYNQKQPQHAMAKEPYGQLALEFAPKPMSIADLVAPTGYKGLSAFHKYWGKKPVECLGFLIEKLTRYGDLVVDPFVGSGLIARECVIRKRRFIGIDINPVSIELANLLSDFPNLVHYNNALKSLEGEVRESIDESYHIADGKTASHYLWDRDTMKEIWIARNGRNGRKVFSPTRFDLGQFEKYRNYTSRLIRPLRFFKNARINTSPSLTLSDIFTGRALRNIDLILQYVCTLSDPMRRAFTLTLTASVGQMSNMVFAITGRGKTNGLSSDKTEVGSWVIGYWRPPLHFEVNVWNCFERRARKFIRALKNMGSSPSFLPSESASDVLTGSAISALLNDDALDALKRLPENTVSLVLTDPPHSDRIPYLEMSELWNAILGRNVDFEKELVVSNAREREKTKIKYNLRMVDLLQEIGRILAPGGMLALLFNARDADSWASLSQKKPCELLTYYGCFPMPYSGNSVVQDNRKGAMKSDYVLLFRKNGTHIPKDILANELKTIPGWSKDMPSKNM